MSEDANDPIYIGLNDRLGTRLKCFDAAWKGKGRITIDDPNDYGYVISRLMAAEAASKARPAKKGGAA